MLIDSTIRPTMTAALLILHARPILIGEKNHVIFLLTEVTVQTLSASVSSLEITHHWLRHHAEVIHAEWKKWAQKDLEHVLL